MATTAPRYSASSGCAPKTMMRSLPSWGGAGAVACASAILSRGGSTILPITKPSPQATSKFKADHFISILLFAILSCGPVRGRRKCADLSHTAKQRRQSGLNFALQLCHEEHVGPGAAEKCQPAPSP